MSARVSELRIDGFRCFEGFHHSVDGLSVFIGENGSGKSTLVEACELLRRTTDAQFVSVVSGTHGGARALLRHGTNRLTLGVGVDGLLGSSSGNYEISLGLEGGRLVIDTETFVVDGRLVGTRSPSVMVIDVPNGSSRSQPPPQEATLFSYAMHFPREHPVRAMRDVLAGIEVFPPLAVTARWASEGGQSSLVRLEQNPSIERRVGRFGVNLPGALLEMRNDPQRWERMLMLVRAAIGDDVENITIGPGDTPLLTFGLKFRGDPTPVTAESLSDGTVALIALIAILELQPPTRSLLVLDEPELHLHPSVVGLLGDQIQRASRSQSILVTSHSDRLLDALQEPHRSAVVLERGERGVVSGRRLDKDALARWLVRYSGLGELRSAGHLPDVVKAS